MVERKEYLERLFQWKDEQVIKVITGIRRCGKSTLLMQYQTWLKANGVSADQIVSVNFEELEYEELLDYRKLYEYLKNHLCVGKKTYIFQYEMQKAASLEPLVESLYDKPEININNSGSNTALDAEQGLAEYMRDGGLPYIAVMNRTSEKVETYLEGIYNTVIVKDIEDRQARKESEPSKRKITDITLLKTIAKYLASVAGTPVSIRSITNYLTSNGRKLSPNTVSDYVDALIESFIFYPAERFDIVGKQLLKANRKLYIVDLGLRNYILPRQNYDLGFSFENIVYFELLRRGYRVMIGKVGNTEVDFVAERKSTYSYIQVTADMTAKETFERELKPLSNIRDNYEKIILTADRFTPGNYNGIQVKYLPDWLLGKNS